jgi:copper chaperone CopZ
MFWKKQTDTQSTQISFQIEGMHCNSCAFNIDTALEELPGVAEAKTSYAHSHTIVLYDPKKTSVEQMMAAITSVGYSARPKK